MFLGPWIKGHCCQILEESSEVRLEQSFSEDLCAVYYEGFQERLVGEWSKVDRKGGKP